jgi:hypothetical protein
MDWWPFPACAKSDTSRGWETCPIVYICRLCGVYIDEATGALGGLKNDSRRTQETASQIRR